MSTGLGWNSRILASGRVLLLLGPLCCVLACSGDIHCEMVTGFELTIDAPTEEYLDYFGTLYLGARESPLPIECRRGQFSAEYAEAAEAACAGRKLTFGSGSAIARLELEEASGRFGFVGPLDVRIVRMDEHELRRDCAYRIYGATARLEPVSD